MLDLAILPNRFNNVAMCTLVAPLVSLCNASSVVAFRNTKAYKNNNNLYHNGVSSPLCLFVFHASSNVVNAARNMRCSASNPILNTDMDAIHSSSMMPLHCCKIVHLVRHAQGIHNVAGEKDHSAYFSEELFDAHLTHRGWNQVDNLRKHVIASGLAKKIDLVITSPLLRTMQTAVGVFGGEGYADEVRGSALMVENAGNSDCLAISSLDCPPFIAVEACREHLGVHPCDRRRTISDYQKLFPAINFSLIESDDDILWKPDVREANDEVAVRGMKFINWLWTRKEREIVVVTHSGFLFHTLNRFAKDSHPLIKNYIRKHFANCELRSIVLVDSSLFGSETAFTNYPGNIPQGADLPSDTAQDKHPQMTGDK